MTDQEVNKIIAEFMGGGIVYYYGEPIRVEFPMEMQHLDCKLYTESLDSLVPVWKKLELTEIGCEFFSNEVFYFKVCKPTIKGDFNGETIQQAAAHATAKAILELKKEGAE